MVYARMSCPVEMFFIWCMLDGRWPDSRIIGEEPGERVISPKHLYICSIGDVYMVQAMIDISKEANQILNIVKARHNLHDKSKAIEKVVLDYGAEILEPELKPEFIEKMKQRQREPAVKVADFKKHFGLS